MNPAALGYSKICIVRGRYKNKINEQDIRNILDQLGNLMIHIQHLGRGFEFGFYEWTDMTIKLNHWLI